jgi:hypothetical protein
VKFNLIGCKNMESFIKAGHIEPSVIIFDVFGTLVK